MSSAPVLIVGTGRCGSTLLSQMIRLHPTVLSVSELFSFVTDFGLRIPRAFPASPIDGERFWRILSEPLPRQSILLSHGLQMPEVIYPLGRGRFRAEDGIPPILQALLPHLDLEQPDALFDALVPVMSARAVAPVADHYRALFEWLAARFKKQTWAERSGGGLRVAHRLMDAFPEARVVHIVRDGRDTAVSMARHIGFRMAMAAMQLVEFLGVDPFESDDRSEESDLPEELADLLPECFTREAFERFDVSPVACGHYWSGEIITGLDVLATLPSERLCTVRYEDILLDPVASTRRLGRFIASDAIREEWVQGAAALVGKARSSWQELPARERAELDAACKPGLEALRQVGLHFD